MLTSGRSRRSGVLPPYTDLASRRWFLAPARLFLEPESDLITLHTIQTREAYQTLARESVLVGDSSRGWEEFQEAYGWMLRQMDVRGLPGTAGGLLWLWPAPTARDLRGSARRARGDVLLTVRVALGRALLSEFSDWHAVLNRYLHVPARPDESHKDREARWMALDDDFRARAKPYDRAPLVEWPTELRAELESSWVAIFDPSTWSTNQSLQATMREVHAADVVRAVRIR